MKVKKGSKFLNKIKRSKTTKCKSKSKSKAKRPIKYQQITNFYTSLQHPEKYCGKQQTITLRSSYEIKYAIKLDNNESVLKWSSEDDIIQYMFPYEFKMGMIVDAKPRIRRYFMDFYKEELQEDGSIKEFLIEVKPGNQTKEPNKNSYSNPISYAKAVYTYQLNLAKWEAAKEFCDNERKRGRKIYFRICTEKDLI